MPSWLNTFRFMKLKQTTGQSQNFDRWYDEAKTERIVSFLQKHRPNEQNPHLQHAVRQSASELAASQRQHKSTPQQNARLQRVTQHQRLNNQQRQHMGSKPFHQHIPTPNLPLSTRNKSAGTSESPVPGSVDSLVTQSQLQQNVRRPRSRTSLVDKFSFSPTSPATSQPRATTGPPTLGNPGAGRAGHLFSPFHSKSRLQPKRVQQTIVGFGVPIKQAASGHVTVLFAAGILETRNLDTIFCTFN